MRSKSSSSALPRLLNVIYVTPLESHPSTKKQAKRVDEGAGGLGPAGQRSGQPDLGPEHRGRSGAWPLRREAQAEHAAARPALGDGTTARLAGTLAL